MARQLLPGLENHRLQTLAALFGINLEHHKAAADAETCARIAMILGQLAEPTGMADFVRDYRETIMQPESTHHGCGIVVRISMERGIEISMDGEESDDKT